MKVPTRVQKVCEGVTSVCAFGDAIFVGGVDAQLLHLGAEWKRVRSAQVPLGTVNVRANEDIVAVSSFANAVHIFDRATLTERATLQDGPSCLTSR